MPPIRRRLILVLALVGLAACVEAFSRFVLTLMRNGLLWRPELSAREFYLAVGDAYGRGFTVGFFFAFFLVVLAFAVSAALEGRRLRRGAVSTLARAESPAEACEG